MEIFPKQFNAFISFLTLSLLLLSCNKTERECHNLVIEMIGKDIIMPSSFKYTVENMIIPYDYYDPDYYIITYVDSSRCTSCSLKLKNWTLVIDELNSLTDKNIGLITIINTKNHKNIAKIVTKYDFKHPIVIDSTNLFYSQNNLPKYFNEHTFLTDNSNKIIAIGNPVTNPKIKELYKEIILSDSDNRYKSPLTSIEYSINLGIIKQFEDPTKTIYVKNNDSITYTLEKIITSCDCVSVTPESSNIHPNDSIKLQLSILDSIPGYFNKDIDVFVKEKKSAIHIKLQGFII